MEENMNQFNEKTEENAVSNIELQEEKTDEIIKEEIQIPLDNIEADEQKTYSETINEQEDYSNPFSNEQSTPFDNSSVYNPINYSPVDQVYDYKPMSKGLKFFALIMAAVILLTATSLAGYFVGKNSNKIKTQYRTDISVDLSAKPTKTDELTAAQVYEKANKFIVGILVYNNSGKSGQASGIVFSEDGYIVTNDHIYSEVPGAKFRIYTYDGKEYDAKYVAGDQVSDLAVLKIDAKGFTPAEFGNSDELVYGENVVAIGRPSDATDASSITKGIVSAINRRIQTTSNYSARLIQTDSAINPGSSGGALVNMYGQVVGVTSSKLASVEYDAVGYAIPTTVMKRIVDELISEGKVVSRAKLGVTYTVIDAITAEMSEYPVTGVLIATVAEDSDLYGKIGEGDIITHVNGTEITSDTVILDIIEQSRAGEKVSVTVYTTSGKTKTVDAVLKANVSESSYVEINETDDSSSNGETFDFPFGQ